MKQQFYQVGGSLPADSKSYIIREADERLYRYLKEGKYCYVLNARQVGKSSLRVHTSKRLEEEGYSCVNIDLTSIGSEGISVEAWYFSFVFSVIEQLHLDYISSIEWWNQHKELSIVNRFYQFFDKFVLSDTQINIVIFIDEIDSVLSINKFSTDNFFAVIRNFFNLRSEDRRYCRLSFVLFGVATSNDLMQDSFRTPFNIAHSVEIKQFVLSESYTLIDGLGVQSVDKREILDKIFEWTSGTPYLTQKLLYYISTHPIDSIDDIDNIVDRLFLTESFKEVNISSIQNRILNNDVYNVQMLYIIKRLQKREQIKMDSCNISYIYLKLSGLVKDECGELKYRNKIYETIFDESWQKRVISKIDKPFVQDLKKWLDLDRLDSALLSGKALKEAQYWARHNQLSSLESEYIRYSDQKNSKRSRFIFLSLYIVFFGLFYFYHKQSIVTVEEQGCAKSCITEVHKKVPSTKEDTFISIRGKTIHINKTLNGFFFPEYKDKIVILEFFGKDCVHCIKEIPVIYKIRQKYREKLEVISIQAQARMSLDEARNYINRYNIRYPIIEGSDAINLQYFVEKTYRWTGILPFTLVVENNVSEFVYGGEVSYQEIAKDIDSLINN